MIMSFIDHVQLLCVMNVYVHVLGPPGQDAENNYHIRSRIERLQVGNVHIISLFNTTLIPKNLGRLVKC